MSERHFRVGVRALREVLRSGALQGLSLRVPPTAEQGAHGQPALHRHFFARKEFPEQTQPFLVQPAGSVRALRRPQRTVPDILAVRTEGGSPVAAHRFQRGTLSAARGFQAQNAEHPF